MKIGLLAYSTNTGLGYQTLEFFEKMKPEKTLIADLSRYNGVETHHERFPGARIDKCEDYNLLSQESCEWLVDDMDVVFICETPLNHYIFEYAEKKGVPTVLQYNYEFLAYHRKPLLTKPTVLASPTQWGIEQVKRQKWAEVMHWPVPVDIDKFEYREFSELKTFIHIIGRPAANDRNGTRIFLEAAMHLPDFNFIVYLQRPKEARTSSHFAEVDDLLRNAKSKLGDRLEIIEDVPDNKTMYSRGEALILPRRYGGLCLPMWEALSSGMPVIMPDVSPNETILPKEWLIPAESTGSFMAHTYISLYDAKVVNLVTKMVALAKNIAPSNKKARELAEAMSWDVQKPIYEERFQKICE